MSTLPIGIPSSFSSLKDTIKAAIDEFCASGNFFVIHGLGPKKCLFIIYQELCNLDYPLLGVERHFHAEVHVLVDGDSIRLIPEHKHRFFKFFFKFFKHYFSIKVMKINTACRLIESGRQRDVIDLFKKALADSWVKEMSSLEKYKKK